MKTRDQAVNLIGDYARALEAFNDVVRRQKALTAEYSTAERVLLLADAALQDALTGRTD